MTNVDAEFPKGALPIGDLPALATTLAVGLAEVKGLPPEQAARFRQLVEHCRRLHEKALAEAREMTAFQAAQEAAWRQLSQDIAALLARHPERAKLKLYHSSRTGKDVCVAARTKLRAAELLGVDTHHVHQMPNGSALYLTALRQPERPFPSERGRGGSTRSASATRSKSRRGASAADGGAGSKASRPATSK